MEWRVKEDRLVHKPVTNEKEAKPWGVQAFSADQAESMKEGLSGRALDVCFRLAAHFLLRKCLPPL